MVETTSLEEMEEKGKLPASPTLLPVLRRHDNTQRTFFFSILVDRTGHQCFSTRSTDKLFCLKSSI